jgi:hypothetical protein
LGVGLNRFFVPETNGEALLEDPFIQGLRPFLRQLDWEQWQSILKRLAAISDHVSSGNGHGASVSTAPAVSSGAIGASDAPSCDGPPVFGPRYVAAISKMSKIFAEKAPKWGLESGVIEGAFSRYLSGAIGMLRVGTDALRQENVVKVTNVLKSITKVDFGLTALVLVFEDSIIPERWIVQETFVMTSKALDEYQNAVSALFENRKAPAPIAGSLGIEGDVDQALESFSKGLQSLFTK